MFQCTVLQCCDFKRTVLSQKQNTFLIRTNHQLPANEFSVPIKSPSFRISFPAQLKPDVLQIRYPVCHVAVHQLPNLPSQTLSSKGCVLTHAHPYPIRLTRIRNNQPTGQGQIAHRCSHTDHACMYHLSISLSLISIVWVPMSHKKTDTTKSFLCYPDNEKKEQKFSLTVTIVQWFGKVFVG